MRQIPDFIDCHAHTNFAIYDSDRDAVIRRALKEKVWMINVGTQKDTSKKACDLTLEYFDGVYAIVGIHPIHTDKSFHNKKELGEENSSFVSKGEVWSLDNYESFFKNSKVVGIGECGLDYFHLDKDTEIKQKKTFEAQVDFANKVGKPLMLHIRNPQIFGRNAYKDAYEILKVNTGARGDIHFFSGSWEDAKLFLNIGFNISFTGVITFTRVYDEIIKNAPLDMILSETDCPYVAPIPYRGKRNEPLFVREVVKTIAEIKKEDFEKVRAQLVKNAIKLFDL